MIRCACGLLLCFLVYSQNCSNVAGGGCVATATCVSDNVCQCQPLGLGDGTLGDYPGRGCHTGSGKLTYLGKVNKDLDKVDGLRGIVQSPDGKHVYVGGNYRILCFTRDPASGVLQRFNTLSFSTRQGYPFLAIAPDGNNLYYIGTVSGSSSARSYRRDVQSGELESLGLHAGLREAFGLVVSPDGLHVYIGNSTCLTIYQRGADGALSLSTNVCGMLDTVIFMVMSSDGKYLYVTSGKSHSVFVFQRDPGSGLLTQIQIITQGSNVTCLNVPHHIVASSDGRYVYVDDLKKAVAIFKRIDGLLAFDSCVFVEGGHSLVAAPDNYIYTIGDSSIVHFGRDPGTGRLLESSQTRVPTSSLEFAVITLDARHLYGVDALNQTVAMLGRDALDICLMTPFPDGYVNSNLSDSTSGCARGFSCAVQLGCAPGFDGANASVTCPDHLVRFEFSGCKPTLCAVDQHVESHACVACAAGSTNGAGDSAEGADTACHSGTPEPSQTPNPTAPSIPLNDSLSVPVAPPEAFASPAVTPQPTFTGNYSVKIGSAPRVVAAAASFAAASASALLPGVIAGPVSLFVQGALAMSAACLTEEQEDNPLEAMHFVAQFLMLVRMPTDPSIADSIFLNTFVLLLLGVAIMIALHSLYEFAIWCALRRLSCTVKWLRKQDPAFPMLEMIPVVAMYNVLTQFAVHPALANTSGMNAEEVSHVWLARLWLLVFVPVWIIYYIWMAIIAPRYSHFESREELYRRRAPMSRIERLALPDGRWGDNNSILMANAVTSKGAFKHRFGEIFMCGKADHLRFVGCADLICATIVSVLMGSPLKCVVSLPFVCLVCIVRLLCTIRLVPYVKDNISPAISCTTGLICPILLIYASLNQGWGPDGPIFYVCLCGIILMLVVSIARWCIIRNWKRKDRPTKQKLKEERLNLLMNHVELVPVANSVPWYDLAKAVEDIPTYTTLHLNDLLRKVEEMMVEVSANQSLSAEDYSKALSRLNEHKVRLVSSGAVGVGQVDGIMDDFEQAKEVVHYRKLH